MCTSIECYSTVPEFEKKPIVIYKAFMQLSLYSTPVNHMCIMTILHFVLRSEGSPP